MPRFAIRLTYSMIVHRYRDVVVEAETQSDAEDYAIAHADEFVNHIYELSEASFEPWEIETDAMYAPHETELTVTKTWSDT